ncbi:hypothetical protein FQN60_010457 [Etheostoma spectabile]|uniref:Synaptopodin n=2 Tax=Etheostoma spectabile TaxID=54343 RepID=A0A5J5D319_9PERO|nr:hypothetical protein FQN60_010457 [Etheostoma spectabile]
MSPFSPPPSQFPVSSVSQYPPMPHYGPPTATKPSTFVPQPAGERMPITPIKTGILEEGAAKRGSRKAMFTFKEKTVVAPNPELLSLVQGVDERKKHGCRSVPEPASEEELLALGAEASNFLAKEEDRTEEAKAPEWASCLKTSRTRPRAEHRPEHTLTNVSGKGAELFAKRQSRMEKYVVEKQNAAQIRCPSPTMSLPPSWVFPSNMPGRVKAIAKNSDMSAQLSQTLKAQQVVKQKPRGKAPAPEPIPEPPPLENGCSKIEMDLSRHQPYQLSLPSSSLTQSRTPLVPYPEEHHSPRAWYLPSLSQDRLPYLLTLLLTTVPSVCLHSCLSAPQEKQNVHQIQPMGSQGSALLCRLFLQSECPLLGQGSRHQGPLFLQRRQGLPHRHQRNPPQLKPPVRLPHQPGRPASPDVSAAQKARPVGPGLPASKLIGPPPPVLAAQ